MWLKQQDMWTPCTLAQATTAAGATHTQETGNGECGWAPGAVLFFFFFLNVYETVLGKFYVWKISSEHSDVHVLEK